MGDYRSMWLYVCVMLIWHLCGVLACVACRWPWVWFYFSFGWTLTNSICCIVWETLHLFNFICYAITLTRIFLFPAWQLLHYKKCNLNGSNNKTYIFLNPIIYATNWALAYSYFQLWFFRVSKWTPRVEIYN